MYRQKHRLREQARSHKFGVDLNYRLGTHHCGSELAREADGAIFQLNRVIVLREQPRSHIG